MELKRERIIRGLECCTDEDKKCTDCPRFGFLPCTKPLMTDALSLIKELTEENERLRKHEITYETPSGKQTMPDLLSLDGDTAEFYKRIEDNIKADTVREMQTEIEARCIKGGIYPVFVRNIVNEVAKELANSFES